MARAFHLRLLPRLAQYQGVWHDDQLKAAVTETYEALVSEVAEGTTAAIALVVGRRLIMSSGPGTVCAVVSSNSASGSVELISDGQGLQACSLRLEEHHVGLALSNVASVTERCAILRPHLVAGHPKAACVALVSEARGEGQLVVAAARFTWVDATAPAKRRRVEEGKIRCRHIMLRFVGAKVEPGGKKVKRTVEEAEGKLVTILDALTERKVPVTRGSIASSFTTQCKALSECQTSLKGGDLAGDLGWLDRDPAKTKTVPAPVVRAACLLDVNEISDLVASERGVHVLLRTA